MRRIEWTPTAKEAWEKIATYIFESFGINALLDYERQTEELMTTLAMNPSAFAPEPLLSDRAIPYRSTLIHRLTKVIYYADAEVVYIVHIWDTRQEPINQVRMIE